MAHVIEEGTGKPRSLTVNADGELIVAGVSGGGGGGGDASLAEQQAQTTLLTAIDGHVDGVEGALTTLAGYLDGVETKLDTLHTDLATLDGHVDGLEGFTDGIETLLGTGNTNTGNAATSLGVMDDWDESDRAKVNIIVGQAGVSAGSGAIDAGTQRVASATDDILRPVTKVITVSKTRPNNTTTYAVSDVYSEDATTGTIWTFSNAARANGLGGIIQSAVLIHSVAQTLKIDAELWLFDTTIASGNQDNAAWALTDAEAKTLIGVIPFSAGSFKVGNGNGIIMSDSLALPFQCAAGTTSIFGQVILRNAYVPVALEELTFRLRILQD
jgi:hypothetical protein